MSSMHRGEEKEAMQVDWSHFTLADFLELRWRLLNDWQAVLPGGEYFGQVRIGDVCYDIQIEWLTEDESDTGDASVIKQRSALSKTMILRKRISMTWKTGMNSAIASTAWSSWSR